MHPPAYVGEEGNMRSGWAVCLCVCDRRNWPMQNCKQTYIFYIYSRKIVNHSKDISSERRIFANLHKYKFEYYFLLS